MINQVEEKAREKKERLSGKISDLKDEIAIVKSKFDEETMNRQCYDQMLIRIKKDRVALEAKTYNLDRKLVTQEGHLEEENEKWRRLNESRYQSKVMLEGLRKSVDLAKRKKDERIYKLERNIRQRQDAAFRRE
jgi:hypothetical protein